MILFFDVVSSLPEFSLIEDNKVIYSKKIHNISYKKMSDNIVPAYLELEKEFSLNNKLKLLIVNTGPGSYTALRVGIAFLSGLSLSKNIDLIGLNCLDIFSYEINKHNLNSSGIFIESSNDQKFIYIYQNFEDNFKIIKIDKNDSLKLNDIFHIKKIYTNSIIALNKIQILMNIERQEFFFKNLVACNIDRIALLPQKDIIRPIYISNNETLN
jgi:tRNA A37 threonylcarbamoyladenosine modification protein TsaB